ncbi:MAG: pteridine reductase [Gammaproteobacteria bacterium]|nr:pteridine reductase [Gammaproteobacteria bacterium]MDP7271838.1 pteridine reductase [Gammaproteobacteria bacterium]HJP05375.1 pteridine reductase [Gammaproteobacteria bacterium]
MNASITDNSTALDGQWVLITGAARRIGAAIAHALHAHGANIAVHYRDSADDAEQLANALNGGRASSALTVKADLLDSSGLAQLVEGVVEQTGRLDVLVNNASTFYATPLDEVTEKDWDDLLGTNLKAPLFLAKAAAPHLRETGGCIVNIVDIHAHRPLKNYPVYGPAKAGLAMLTRSLAKDLAPEIRVNGVSPGAILWPEDDMPAKVQQSIIKQIPMGRTGEPDDIARTVLFLVKDAPYVTGQIIAVDGGRSAGW